MSMKKIFILFLFCLAGFSSFQTKAQPKSFSQKVDWIQYAYLFNQDNSTELVLNYRIPLNNDNGINNVKIVDALFTPLQQNEQKIKSIENIPNEISIDFSTSVSRKVNYLDIKLDALRFNADSKTIEKLSSFKIEYSVNKSQKSATNQNRTYATNSVLSQGSWYKIMIDTSGVFKISYDDIINLGITNPENIAVFGNGGKQLPYQNSEFNYDDLIENPVYMNKGTDGIFNSGDYILFWGEGSTAWNYDESAKMFKQNLHSYSKEAFYFLTSDSGERKKIQTTNDNTLTPTYTTSSYDSYRYIEDEHTNLVRSGRIWWGDLFKQNESKKYSFTFPNLIHNDTIKASTRIAGRKASSASTCTFTITHNDQTVSQIPITDSYRDYVWGHQYSDNFTFTAEDSYISLEYKLTGGNSSIKGYLDYICLNAREKLSMNAYSQLQFRDASSALAGQVSKFSIANLGENLIVWNITNPLEPFAVTTSNQNNTTSFTTKTDSIIEFVAFTPTNAFTPSFSGDNLGEIKNQNLHGISAQDMIIVTHPDFINEADTIAKLHRDKDNMKVLVTTPQEVYNEFSSGSPDVSAIRNFVRMCYDRSNGDDDLIKYLLLMGDGSYDNRSTENKNSNFILTYQSEESLQETISYVTDDFFGLLDYSEGEGNGSLDIGIGRYPVQTAEEAEAINDKIKNYLSEESLGSWRNQICFIGDDGDSNIHMRDPDNISKTLKRDYPEYNVNKIFSDAYTRISTPMGFRYPDVTTAINEQVKKGALIIDYVGHGNPRILAHEIILEVPDVKSWKNKDKLSIFVTASCEVGRYDDYDRISLGEWIVLNPDGGGVAALTTTRVVYSGANNDLNTNFFRYVLNPDLRLGDVIRLAKVNTASGINKRNFSLLGDPALKLAVPEKKSKVSYINDYYVLDDNDLSTNNITENELSIQLKNTTLNIPADTLKALSKANVSGEIYDKENNLLTDYNGTLQVSIYDKPDSITCNGYTTSSIFKFEVQNSVLYNGQASITNGTFDFDFIIPKDINYKYDNGKISLYAKSDMGEAIGYSENFIIGGIEENADSDNNGPIIALFMNDTTFEQGGITNENPELLAQLSDESGINTTGNGIGHNITAIIDGDQYNSIVLNSFYVGNVDQYNSGEVKYQLDDLSPGEHTIVFKAWDIYNNSSETEITFNVFEEQDVVVTNMINSPNPFSDETFFTIDHNQTKDAIQVTIKVFDLMGSKVAELTENENNESYSIDPIRWDGKGFGGATLPNGMYLYSTEIKAANGEISTQSSKLMIFK